MGAMGVDGFLWVLMGIYESMDVYGCLRVSMNIYGVLWVFMGIYGFL